MSRTRLIHDASWQAALKILACIENCLRSEEMQTALHELYLLVKQAILDYEAKKVHEMKRLNPEGSES